ncbi:dol-P-Glc:Glc(2)Man(9)GlcNAc(2)-PP-Dol alpha-1,2-glucosyltransferase isoform X2 [Ziziphus jujuba]|uniref:Dol-P-Glc:Glc(2)Man(9)GlcNAc(2)-PP-Dol alpha-1,2-glucosyltransferase n=1 Tax=Ziziphus jujuba TaxID=326968 RepID=A0ABM3I4D0_ZIZJJ|nr:dol-P-Glc:Glc(2)Man(9)GlcNAc(2)-PP-Dol alpha-1,2-glucosyltransferase isoform X2 [Ziziphus jujuba]
MGRIAVAAIVSSWVIPISIIGNRIVSEPYMDEIFHIRQAQQYCKGNFRSWDPMITTPPGLYYLSLAHVASLFPGMFYLKAVSSFPEVCSIPILRSINGILAILCSILIYEIITNLRPTLDERKATVYAVVLSMYPLHWFFTFLYYTDVASLTAVLAMYLACLRKNYWFSGLLGALAVVIRQTNIIWMLFVACSGIIDLTFACKRDKIDIGDGDASIKYLGQQASMDGAVFRSSLRKRKINTPVDTGIQPMPTKNASSKASISGAKEAHGVSLHFAQIMYFGLFSALLMAPLYFSVSQALDLFHSIWRNKPLSFFQAFMAFIASFISVHFFSIAHPYLLADNRHYTFYLWRKVIKAHWSFKYLLVPLYVYSWLSIFARLGKVQRKIWVLAFFLATTAVLVPAPLIEFRYFTIPFFFLMLHSHVDDYQSWFLMGLLYIAINVFTMMMFLYRPFHWDHEPGIQRFIW